MNSCTFYSLKGTIPAHINSIYIQPIVNQSSDQDINDLIDDKLNDLLISQNILEIVDYDTADSKIELIIVKISDTPYTLSKGQTFETVNVCDKNCFQHESETQSRCSPLVILIFVISISSSESSSDSSKSIKNSINSSSTSFAHKRKPLFSAA